MKDKNRQAQFIVGTVLGVVVAAGLLLLRHAPWDSTVQLDPLASPQIPRPAPGTAPASPEIWKPAPKDAKAESEKRVVRAVRRSEKAYAKMTLKAARKNPVLVDYSRDWMLAGGL